MTKLTNTISVNYSTAQGRKSGLITLNLRYIAEENRLDCLGAEFSDCDVEERMTDTSILTDIYSQMENQLLEKNELNLEYTIANR
jgi:hypothetical protein